MHFFSRHAFCVFHETLAIPWMSGNSSRQMRKSVALGSFLSCQLVAHAHSCSPFFRNLQISGPRSICCTYFSSSKNEKSVERVEESPFAKELSEYIPLELETKLNCGWTFILFFLSESFLLFDVQDDCLDYSRRHC